MRWHRIKCAHYYRFRPVFVHEINTFEKLIMMMWYLFYQMKLWMIDFLGTLFRVRLFYEQYSTRSCYMAKMMNSPKTFNFTLGTNLCVCVCVATKFTFLFLYDFIKFVFSVFVEVVYILANEEMARKFVFSPIQLRRTKQIQLIENNNNVTSSVDTGHHFYQFGSGSSLCYKSKLAKSS